jgi:hypothetical protein
VYKVHAYTRRPIVYEKKIKPDLLRAGWESILVRMKDGYMIAIRRQLSEKIRSVTEGDEPVL